MGGDGDGDDDNDDDDNDDDNDKSARTEIFLPTCSKNCKVHVFLFAIVGSNRCP